MRLPSALRKLCALAVFIALTACGGPEVIHARGPDRMPALEVKSLGIDFKDKIPTSWSKHQAGLIKPEFTPEEKVAAAARAKAISLDILHNLPTAVRSQLTPYLAGSERASRNVLILEITGLAVDTDGSAQITMEMYCGPRGELYPDWTRTVRVSASRLSAPETVTRDLVAAILAQLKTSALIAAS